MFLAPEGTVEPESTANLEVGDIPCKHRIGECCPREDSLAIRPIPGVELERRVKLPESVSRESGIFLMKLTPYTWTVGRKIRDGARAAANPTMSGMNIDSAVMLEK